MSDYKDCVLEAIDQLRRRKARPDADRIFNALIRRFNMNSTDARNALDRCVETGVVLKVEYKGNISYRNAAKKFSHLKRDANGDVIRSADQRTKFTCMLTKAIADLVLEEPDYLQWGVPGHELIKSILSKDNVRYTKKYVTILLDKEVESGGLIRMDNGNFLVGPAKKADAGREVARDVGSAAVVEFVVDGEDVVRYAAEVMPTDDHYRENGPVRVRKKPGPKPGFKREKLLDGYQVDGNKKDDNSQLRVGGRRKKAKKVFDPSDSNIPKKRGRPVGSLNKSTVDRQLSKLSSDNDSRPESRSSNASHKEQFGVCSVCHLHNNNKKGPSERMVACRECSNKAHYNCLNGDDMMLRMYPDNTWQCPHCKNCVVCYETMNSGPLVVCAICADAYHLTCHQPPILEKMKSNVKWTCVNCQMPNQLAIKDIEGYDNSNKRNVSDSMEYFSSNSGSRNTSPGGRSSTPPTLSPQNVHMMMNGHSGTSPSFSIKSDSVQSAKELIMMDADDGIDPSIPDATHWSYEDVYNYFARYFPDEAVVFREQEIDGRSLLLMKRNDVLTCLKLKLGPALKIYRHVVKLQMRRDDPKYYYL